MKMNADRNKRGNKRIGESSVLQGLRFPVSGMRSGLRGLKSSKAARAWNEIKRTATCLLTCFGLAVSSACSTMPSADTNAAQPTTAATDKAEQLKKLLPRGTDVEITEKSGRVRKVHVTRVDNKTIAGTSAEGRVRIPIAEVGMARVQKAPLKSSRKPDDSPKYKQWGPGDGHLSTTEIVATGVFTGAYIYYVLPALIVAGIANM
jgi:hypothetical protein